MDKKMSTTLLIHLPEESLCSIAQFLLPPDILQFISIHPTFVPLLCHSKHFWSFMNRVHYGNDVRSKNMNERTVDATAILNEINEGWNIEKNQYLVYSHCSTLSSVRWYSVNTTPPLNPAASRINNNFVYAKPSAREGHVSCIIGNYLVLTGGFTDDDDVYIKHLDNLDDGTTWKRLRVTEKDRSPNNRHLVKKWVYGATLSTLDNTRAVMFGGFQSGGYSNETAQVAILHLEVNNSNDDTLSSITQAPVPTVWWEVMECHQSNNDATTAAANCYDTNESFLRIAGRAYHAASLLCDRYLFIVGGMQSRGCILNPILLDCHTGTWYVEGITTGNCKAESSVPSRRHGCSMIAHMEANRLVLFGGGTGTDLLRSGIDNTEVWELIFGNDSANDIFSSMPWTWHIVHENQIESDHDDIEEDGDDEDGEDNSDGNSNEEGDVSDQNHLSSIERLNLGRCHCAHRVSRDVVVLAFGSGQTTNSVLCYNLFDDNFFRTSVHQSFIPRGRFTLASAFLESKGIIVFHGGYSAQRHTEELSDTLLLDLAPGMGSSRNNGRLWLPIASGAQSFPNTSEARHTALDEASNARFFSSLLFQLMNAPVEDQRLISRQMLSVVNESQMNETMRALLRHFAAGQIRIDEEGTIVSYNVDPEMQQEILVLFERLG